mmetsp:Transcript_7535/g.19097  ORF Transcript_7535/g.19097 Transcript_7535/m.19097 type:complete len:290 (+) Transcript_7535:1073-1942(+)
MYCHFIPWYTELVHDFTCTQCLGHQPSPAIPPDKLVERLREHQVPPMWRESEHVVLVFHEVVNFERDLLTMSSHKPGHVVTCCLEIEACRLDGALQSTGPRSDGLGPPTLHLQLRQVHRSLHCTCSSQSVRYIPQSLVSARSLAIRTRSKLSSQFVLLELDECYCCPSSSIALVVFLQANAHKTTNVTLAQVCLDQAPHGLLFGTFSELLPGRVDFSSILRKQRRKLWFTFPRVQNIGPHPWLQHRVGVRKNLLCLFRPPFQLSEPCFGDVSPYLPSSPRPPCSAECVS